MNWLGGKRGIRWVSRELGKGRGNGGSRYWKSNVRSQKGVWKGISWVGN